MKKTILTILATLLLFPSISLARNLVDEVEVKILPFSQINREYPRIGGGAFINYPTGQKDLIVIADIFSPRLFYITLLHELGHFFLQDTSEAKMREMLNDYKSSFKTIQEESASSFVRTMTDLKSSTLNMRIFWAEILQDYLTR